jgi:hypothetical protein
LVHLVHLVHSNDLKYVDIVDLFQHFLSRICCLSFFIDCEGWTPSVIHDAPITKVGLRFHGQMLMNSQNILDFKCDNWALCSNIHDKGILIPESKIEQPKREVIPDILHAILAYKTRFKTECHRATNAFGRNPNSNASP